MTEKLQPFQRRALLFFLTVVLIPRVSPATEGGVRVLFIGNSYTAFHDLPRVFEAVAATSGMELLVETRAAVTGGATLESHWQAGPEGPARKALAEGPWTWVVL